MIRSTRELYAGRALLVIVMAVTIVPFLSIFTTALHPSGSVPAPLEWPAQPHWGNFVEAFEAANLGALLGSSTFIAVAVVPASVILSTIAGFAIGVLRFPGSRWLFMLFVFGLTLPFTGIVVPLYYLERDMGILNTRFAIVLPLIALYMPFGIFWMRAHFVNMPDALDEAARIDGAGPWNLFRLVHVPRAPPRDRLARRCAFRLDVESVLDRARPCRGTISQNDGGSARSLPGTVRLGHTAACGGNDTDHPAEPDRVRPLPKAHHRRPARRRIQRMTAR